MKTKMYAALLALFGLVAIGFHAAVDEAYGAPLSQAAARNNYSGHERVWTVSTRAPERSDSLGSTAFSTLAFTRANPLTLSEMGRIRGQGQPVFGFRLGPLNDRPSESFTLSGSTGTGITVK